MVGNEHLMIIKQENKMFKKTSLVMSALMFTTLSAITVANAETAPINGVVQSRCVIQTDAAGTYGNPNAHTLTTAPADGGQPAVIRIDVTLADAYYAEITAPDSFSSSPSLPDVVTFVGDTEVQAVSDATNMGSYETNKVEQGLMDRYDLTATGSTWFKTSSTATMGGSKAFPGGSYTALVEAVCIAK
jgi:hypothetical protein